MARRRNQGSKWIRRSTRLAIYHRDNDRCVYCGAAADLTLDHVIACELTDKPDNSPTNLVTACLACNSAKRHLTLRGWTAYLRAARGFAAAETTAMLRRVRNAIARPLDRAEGMRRAA